MNMSTKSEKDKTKQIQDKCQAVLNALLKDEDNKYCVDCDSKGPRWASWNLGVFLCIRCAGIHRNLGVHISKVKSVNLDAWTPEQVVSLQQMGNSRARAVYEANLPDNFRRPQSDSSLESFVRAKYEHKKYIAREWVPPPLPKVNWEKEIDEEIERQKRKKKTSIEKKQLTNVEVPQLPKPKSASPKPGRVTVQQPPPVGEIKQNADLLGLQNGEDTFSGFVSATVTEETKKIEKDSLKSEEESFFNQTAPTEKEKVKLTKDNILALYGNTPVNNLNPVPGYQSQPSFGNQQAFQNFTAYPQQNIPAQNGLTQFTVANQFQQFQAQFPYQQQPTSQYSINNQFQSGSIQPQPNMQFSSLPNAFPPNNPLPNGTNFYASTQFQGVPNLGQMNQFQTQNSGFTGQTPVANPFFSNQGINVQQQFANLSLNNKAANPGPTLATNLWQ